jgi:hypothetical protein
MKTSKIINLIIMELKKKKKEADELGLLEKVEAYEDSIKMVKRISDENSDINNTPW